MENKGVEVVGFWVSPYVHRVRWALKLKGVEYEYIEENVFRKSTFLLGLNPVYGKVPVLVDDGKVLPESLVILEYIDETWKEYPLLPQDPHERAQGRFWAKFAEEKLFRSAWTALCSEGEERDIAVISSKEALNHIEEQLKARKTPFFGGENLGFLDIVLGWVAYMLPIWEAVVSMRILDPKQYPTIAVWMQEFVNHPAVKGEYMPTKDEMFVYFQKRRRGVAAVLADAGDDEKRN